MSGLLPQKNQKGTVIFMSKIVKRNPIRDKMMVFAGRLGSAVVFIFAAAMLISSADFLDDIFVILAVSAMLWYSKLKIGYSKAPSINKAAAASVLLSVAAALTSAIKFVIAAKAIIAEGFYLKAFPEIIRESVSAYAVRSPALMLLYAAVMYFVPVICLLLISSRIFRNDIKHSSLEKKFISIKTMYNSSSLCVFAALIGILMRDISCTHHCRQ